MDKHHHLALLKGTILTLAFFSFGPLPTMAQPTLQPLPPEACKVLQQAMSLALQVSVTQTTEPFEDMLSKAKGESCQLNATVSGAKIQNAVALSQNLAQMLKVAGWQPDQKYAADSPEELMRGFRKGSDLAVLSVKNELDQSVSCPNNVPIATCYDNAKPEQILYQIGLEAVRNK